MSKEREEMPRFEADERFKDALGNDGMSIEASSFSTVEDFDAVFTTPYYLLNFTFVPNEIAAVEIDFKQEFQNWANIYDALTPAQRAKGCHELLKKMKRLQAAGYMALYGIYTSEDNYKVAYVLFGPAWEEGFRKLAYLNVPRHVGHIIGEEKTATTTTEQESRPPNWGREGNQSGTTMETMIVEAKEVLTIEDCEAIIQSDGVLFNYQWPTGEPMSPAIMRHLTELKLTLKVWKVIYHQFELKQERREQQCLCESVLAIVREKIAKEGCRTLYAVYKTAEGKQGCLIAFCSNKLRRHPENFNAPCRLDDLLNFPQKYGGTGNEAA
jgi:hypothetical protein